MHNINTQLFYIVNGLAGNIQSVDQGVIFLTTYLVQIVFVVTGVYMMVWLPFVQTPPTFMRLKHLAYGFEMTFALIVSWVVIKVIKFAVAFPRPFETLMDSNLLIVINGGDSFPSGHSGMTMALATTVYMRHKLLGILLYVFAVLVAFSRMYVGVHYPLDVFVGMAIGILIPTVIYRVFNK